MPTTLATTHLKVLWGCPCSGFAALGRREHLPAGKTPTSGTADSRAQGRGAQV